MNHNDEETQPAQPSKRNSEAELKLTAVYITLAATTINYFEAKRAQSPEAVERTEDQLVQLIEQIRQLRRRYPAENINLIQGAFQEWNR